MRPVKKVIAPPLIGLHLAPVEHGDEGWLGMSQRLHALILDRLAQAPQRSADELASALGASSDTIRAALEGALSAQVRRDAHGRWSLAEGAEPAGLSARPDTLAQPLARLCRYYLSCLLYDADGVSACLSPEDGEADYAELGALPAAEMESTDAAAVRRLIDRRPNPDRRRTAYVGYPLHITAEGGRSEGIKTLWVEPLLLFPAECEPHSGRVRVDLSFPVINVRSLKALSALEGEGLLSALWQLESELGEGFCEGCLRPEEIAVRLRALRPEWPWREPVTGDGLWREGPPLAALSKPGIYNRSVVILADASPFTYGLERELRDLASLSEGDLRGTALHRWLAGGPPQDGPGSDGQGLSARAVQDGQPLLLEVTPMNAEQHQAVAAALSQPLTVITGPPGTGKSQVVTNLLVNAVWSGRRVLFASRNNKAVDVVEDRVNAVGERPSLLRMGAWPSVRMRLAEHVLALMSSASSSSDAEAFREAEADLRQMVEEQAGLLAEAQAVLALRNDVDERERAAEEARAGLGEEVFATAAGVNQRTLGEAIDALSHAARRADRSLASGLPARLWPLIAARRMAALRRRLETCRQPVEAVGVRLPAATRRPDPARVRAHLEAARIQAGRIGRAAHYLRGLRQLQATRSLEAIARAQSDMGRRIARQAAALWRLWLRLRPSQLSAADRTRLTKYQSLLAILTEAGEEAQLPAQTRRQYAAMLRDVFHLLSCWAVTSLSARGRIPFEPGIFDIVVFDEASQCDIASALPLLYRAKSVVVIGDPRQLAHISALPRGQDRALLERHGLLPDFAHWAYSYQSLFGCAASQVPGEAVITLADHHRSHSDIIEFANAEFYQGRLRVATRYDQLRMPDRSEPGIRWVNVRGSVIRPEAGGAVNAEEADAVVRVLRDLVLGRSYDGTLGVVTPFRAQAAAIREALAREPGLAAALSERRFAADTVHRFQGDERDVMIFSPVMAEGIHPGARTFLSGHPNLFNVAITRARAQLIVVGDIAACQAGDVGYLSRFAAYTLRLCQRPAPLDTPPAGGEGAVLPGGPVSAAAAIWRPRFLDAARASGLHLLTGVRIEHYTADFLLTEGARRLVVDIDTEGYHSKWTSELSRRHQLRSQRLFELGYDVMRFWVYEVRDDLPACMARLTEWRAAVSREDVSAAGLAASWAAPVGV